MVGLSTTLVLNPKVAAVVVDAYLSWPLPCVQTGRRVSTALDGLNRLALLVKQRGCGIDVTKMAAKISVNKNVTSR